MGNTQNNSDMNLPPPEKNNIQYHKWIDDIYKEIRYTYLKTNEHHINVLKLLDKFLEKFRQYIQKNHGYSTRMHDYQLVRETNRLMFLIRDLFSERDDQHYLMKTSEILGGCTFLWLRYHSLDDEQYNETHIEKILNCYAIHLQSTTDESFLLKVITHTLYVCKKLPGIFYKILEMHLKRRVQRKGRRNLEAKEDQLYILYIIAFKLWDRLQPDGEDKINIAQYANSYMKPLHSLLSNPRYAPNLPKITSEDVKCGRATKIIINNLLPSKLLKLAEAVVKEDWLKGSDINAPITVDLSIDDDVNRSEQAVENDRTFISVNTELRDLSLYETQSNLSKELWWVKVLQNRARKSMNTTESYRVVEVIDLDDEGVHNCNSISKTNAEMEVQNQSKATQNKDVDNTKKAGQKQISTEENVQTKRQEPQQNKEANSNSDENICKRSATTQEKGDNCEAMMVENHVLEDSQETDEGNSCNKFTGSTEKEVNVGKKSPQAEVVITKKQNTQEPRNEFKSIEEKINSNPKKTIDIEKSQMVSKKDIIKQDTQIIQVESMEIDSIVEETSEISGSKELQLEEQQSEQPKTVKIDRRKSVLKEKPISSQETCSELELNDTPKKGNHSVVSSEENSDVNAVSKDLNKLGLQSMEKAKVKNIRPIKNITPMVKGAIEFSDETSEDEEITNIIRVGETKSKSPIVPSESDGSEGVLCINTEDENNDNGKNLKSHSPLKSVDGNDFGHISDRPIDSIHEKSIHIIDSALNSSVESLQINDSPDDERALDDTISISSIVEESENYDTMDPKINDIHIEKISPVVNVKASTHKKNTPDGPVLFSISTSRKLSPPRKVEEYKEICKEKSPQKDRVVFSTSTANAKIRSASPNYTFIPTPDIDHDEIKSPPVESFSKSDSDEFKQIFNNKTQLNTHRQEKEETTENNKQTEDKNEHTVENIISKKTNQVTKRSILTKTDGNVQNENLSTSNVKRKAVSFATVTQDKAPLFINRTANLDSTIIERKTYDSPLTIQNEPQNWRSSINNSPPLSNQQDRPSQEQDQELELLSTSDVNSLGSSSPPPMKESDPEWNQEDNSHVAEDAISADDVNTSPLEESLSDFVKGLSEQERSPQRRDQFATPSQLVGNPIKENISTRVSFISERTISPNVEVLDKISTMQQPYQALSDFDRYLVGIKRVNTPKLNDSSRKTINLKVDRSQNLKSEPCESTAMMSRIIEKSETPLPSIKTYETQDKVESYRFKNNFERITCKDPKLKKKVVVELKNYTSLQLKKIMNSKRKRSASESSSIMNSGVDNNRRDLSASFQHNQIVNTPKTKIIASSTSPLASPTQYKINPSQIVIKLSAPKEPMLVLRDKSTDVNGLKPIYIRKRRSSVVPEIVIQVFKDKNKKHLNPCVMLKKLDLDALDSHMNEKERHKHKKKDKSRRKSRSKRTSEDEDEMTDSSVGEKYYTRRSSSRTPYSWEKTNNHKNVVNDLPIQSEIELDETQNEISEIDILYPSRKRRRSRSKSSSRSRSRSRSKSKSKSKSKKRRDSKIEFSETDLFLSLERSRSRSRSKSKGRSRSKSKDTQTYPSDVESTSSKKYKSKSGKKAATHNKKIIDLMVDDNHEKTSSPLHFYHEFDYVSSDEETLSIKRHRHLKSRTIDGDAENLNVRDKSTSPVTLPFDLNRPLSSPSLSESEHSTSGSPTRLINNTSRVRRISDIDINFERTHQKSFKEFSDQFSNMALPKSKLNSAQLIRNENDSDSIQESPLFILADDTFMGELIVDEESRRKNSKTSSKYSNSSSDTSDLAILPKRRKMLEVPDYFDENDFVSPEKLSPTGEIDKRVQRKYTSGKKKRKSSSSIKSDRVEARSSGSMSPEITVNINKAKTYSKSNLVQNVFVPAELEMNFDNLSRVGSSYVQSRKDLNNLNYNVNSNRVEMQDPVVQDNISVIGINKLNYSENSDIATQSTHTNILETPPNKENRPNNMNLIQEHQQTNNNDVQNSQPNVGNKDENIFQCENQNRIEIENNETSNSPLNDQGCNIPESEDPSLKLASELTSTEEGQELPKQQLSGVGTHHYNLKEDESHNIHSNEIKRRRSGRPRKPKNSTEHLTGDSSNNIIPENYSDMERRETSNMYYIGRTQSKEANQNRIKIEKNETSNSPLNDEGHDIPESKDPNLKLARELTSTEEGQELPTVQLFGVNMPHYNLKKDESNNTQTNQIKRRSRGRPRKLKNLYKYRDMEGGETSESYNIHSNQIKRPRGRPRKQKNPIEHLTGDSNSAIAANYMDMKGGAIQDMHYIGGMQLKEANQNRIKIEKNETLNSLLNDEGHDIPESKDPNLKLAKELTSTEEGQELPTVQLFGVNMPHYNLKKDESNNTQTNQIKRRSRGRPRKDQNLPNYRDMARGETSKSHNIHSNQIKRPRGRPRKQTNPIEHLTGDSNSAIPANYSDMERGAIQDMPYIGGMQLKEANQNRIKIEKNETLKSSLNNQGHDIPESEDPSLKLARELTATEEGQQSFSVNMPHYNLKEDESHNIHSNQTKLGCGIPRKLKNSTENLTGDSNSTIPANYRDMERGETSDMYYIDGMQLKEANQNRIEIEKNGTSNSPLNDQGHDIPQSEDPNLKLASELTSTDEGEELTKQQFFTTI